MQQGPADTAALRHEALTLNTGVAAPETMAGQRPSDVQHSPVYSRPTSKGQQCAPAASCGPSMQSRHMYGSILLQ